MALTPNTDTPSAPAQDATFVAIRYAITMIATVLGTLGYVSDADIQKYSGFAVALAVALYGIVRQKNLKQTFNDLLDGKFGHVRDSLK